MALRLYNTATRSVDEFAPMDPPKVSLYTCGPTVYDYAHIGNLRTYVFEDVLVRALRYCGCEVNRVMNVTDVGHLVSDADEGEDKMVKGARREGKTVWEIAQFYWDAFRNDMRRLNLIEPETWCRATEHIDEQRSQVELLAEKGYTYVIDGDGIYFDTDKFPAYADFARLDLAGLRAGYRVEMVAGKHNATDFAVWKFSPKDQQRLMEWDNPCGLAGKGFPGWHIECSSMAIKYLGERLDIHCGGVDHVQVHHTNEIAQAEAVMGHKWCNCWMHAEFLTMPRGADEAAPMSKSSGEFLTLDVLIRRLGDKGVSEADAALVYRYFLLGAHYRQQLAFTWEALEGAAAAMKNLKRAVLHLRAAGEGGEPVPRHVEAFRQAVENDLNMPQALAAMWQVVRDLPAGQAGSDADKADAYATLLEMDQILGLGIAEMSEEALGVDAAEIEQLIADRAAARKAKDFAKADAIRNQLAEMGVEIMDSPQGTTWRPS